MQLGTIGSLLGVVVVVGKVELVDSCGSLQEVLEVLVGHPTAIKAVPTPGWQTSSVTKRAMYLRVVLMWATAAKVRLKQTYDEVLLLKFFYKNQAMPFGKCHA